MTKINEYAESLSDDDLRQFVQDFRLTAVGANLTKELKQEWRDVAEYCKKRRRHNWENRDINGVQGKSRGGTRQERMELPRLAELEVEKRFGPDWKKEHKAHDWLWDTYPQFRLIEKR